MRNLKYEKLQTVYTGIEVSKSYYVVYWVEVHGAIDLVKAQNPLIDASWLLWTDLLSCTKR